MWNNATSSGSTLNASSVVYSYNITYTSVITQTRSAGTGIVGIQTQLSNDFSVNVSIVNFLVDTMRLTAIPYDDTVVTYLLVNYIAVGDDTYFMETHFYCTSALNQASSPAPLVPAMAPALRRRPTPPAS